MTECTGTCQYHEQVKDKVSRIEACQDSHKKTVKDDMANCKIEILTEVEKNIKGTNDRFRPLWIMTAIILGTVISTPVVMSGNLNKHRVASEKVHTTNTVAIDVLKDSVKEQKKTNQEILKTLTDISIAVSVLDSKVETLQERTE